MSKFAIGITVILVSCFTFGCGGKTSNESASNSDSKTTGSERPNRNQVRITFDEQTGLPSDIPIPDFMKFVGSQKAGEITHRGFTSEKPIDEVVETMKAELLKAGWRFHQDNSTGYDTAGSFWFFKGEDITKLKPKNYPIESRIFSVTHSKEMLFKGAVINGFLITPISKQSKINSKRGSYEQF